MLSIIVRPVENRVVIVIGVGNDEQRLRLVRRIEHRRLCEIGTMLIRFAGNDEQRCIERADVIQRGISIAEDQSTGSHV